jgi:hypothetical protein
MDDCKKILNEKALFSDISKKPNYYHVLYAFHTSRHNYRQGYLIDYILLI